MKKILIFTLSLFLFWACGTAKKSNDMNASKSNKGLNGQWVLFDETKDEAVMGMRDKPFTIEFMKEDGNRVSGFSGCNQYGGEFTIDRNFISFENMYSSKMACPNLKEEQNFMSLLQSVNNYKIEGNELRLYKDRILLLRFQK